MKIKAGFLGLFFILVVEGLSAGTPLNEDEKAWLDLVRPIITHKERKVFRKKLQSRRDRERFKDLFWAKRSDDPQDAENTFKREYLARFDYVMAHFEEKRATSPITPMGKLYLLLGRPTEMKRRIDYSLTGIGYRNPYPHYPVHLWTYKEVGFNYKPRRLKIQFIPISVFGDYAALTDRYTGAFLRNLKFKLILHPDLEEAPLTALESEDLQYPVSVTEVDIAVPAVDTSPAPKEAAPAVSEVPLSVPSLPTIAEAPAQPAAEPAPLFTPELGNKLGLTLATTALKRGPEQALLVGRLGVPLSALPFTFKTNEYEAPFTMRYRLENERGEPLLTQQLRNTAVIADLRVTKREDAFFSKEVAALVPPGRYTFKWQVESESEQGAGYFEQVVEVPSLDDQGPRQSGVVLLDPNVYGDTAKLRIVEEPMTLRLHNSYRKGDRIHPLVEVANVGSTRLLEQGRFQALGEGDQVVQEWQLFEEETTSSPQGTVLIHPVLESRKLAPGRYRLRFSLPQDGGQTMVSETVFEIR